jgi:type I restriction enzyme M protein
VLFVQKWNDDATAGPLCPKVDDYNIFFATMRKPGKDNSGEKVFVKNPKAKLFGPETKEGETVKDLLKQGELELQEPEEHYNTLPQSDYLLDENGHLIVDHDLFNHEGLTQDGIAEAFIEFAKKERLSFFL